MRWYRPGIGWYPNAPTLSGGSKEWTGEHLLDWSTGYLVPRKLAEAPRIVNGRKVKRSEPGLRVKPLKSSATHKYHEGGTYHGAKLRKTIKDKYKRVVELLPDVYTIPGYKGRYEYQRGEDRYLWVTD